MPVGCCFGRWFPASHRSYRFQVEESKEQLPDDGKAAESGGEGPRAEPTGTVLKEQQQQSAEIDAAEEEEEEWRKYEEGPVHTAADLDLDEEEALGDELPPLLPVDDASSPALSSSASPPPTFASFGFSAPSATSSAVSSTSNTPAARSMLREQLYTYLITQRNLAGQLLCDCPRVSSVFASLCGSYVRLTPAFLTVARRMHRLCFLADYSLHGALVANSTAPIAWSSFSSPASASAAGNRAPNSYTRVTVTPPPAPLPTPTAEPRGKAGTPTLHGGAQTAARGTSSSSSSSGSSALYPASSSSALVPGAQQGTTGSIGIVMMLWVDVSHSLLSLVCGHIGAKYYDSVAVGSTPCRQMKEVEVGSFLWDTLLISSFSLSPPSPSFLSLCPSLFFTYCLCSLCLAL